jgi:hypothetical protein
MDLYVYNLDEYSCDSRQGNEFAPSWPFRLAVAGSSDSGKTTMIINLLMGNKKAEEDGERYILCDAILLVGRYLNEPKWTIVQNFFNELQENGEDVSFTRIPYTEIPDVEEFDSETATVVIFEDLMDAPKKVQEKITGYFTHGRHKNVSSIYVSQRFFSIPKVIRENVNYISLHGGHGSLSDTKRIISQYTEESETIAPIIDELTLQKEFVIFDLRRSRNDPLSIRVRWDTSLRSILDQSQINLRSSQINLKSIQDQSKFSLYGQKAVAEAKKNGKLVEFASSYPSPKERRSLLADKVDAKNSDIWIKYVFREAYGLYRKNLGADYQNFLAKVKVNRGVEEESKELTSPNVKVLFSRYETLKSGHPLSDEKIVEGIEILLQLFAKGYMNQIALQIGISNLFTSQK